MASGEDQLGDSQSSSKDLPAFEELFLTDAEHLEIRTITTLLRYTQNVVGGKNLVRSKYSLHDVEDGKIYNDICSSFLNATARGGPEVCALHPGPLKQPTTKVNLIGLNPVLQLTRNPQLREMPQTSPNERPRVEIKSQPYPTDIDLSDDLFRDPLKHFLLAQAAADYRIPIGKIASIFLRLVRNHRHQSSNEAASQTYRQTLYFCIAVGHAKIRTRVSEGLTQRNFMAILCINETCWEELEEYMPKDQEDWNRVQGLFNQTESDGVLANELTPDMPTEKQSGLLRSYFKESCNLSDEEINSPLFDKAGRRRMKRVMATTLTSLVKDLRTLEKFMPVQKRREYSLKPLRRAVIDVAIDLQRLDTLLTHFELPVHKTIAWLMAVTGIKHSTPSSKQAYSSIAEGRGLRSSSSHQGTPVVRSSRVATPLASTPMQGPSQLSMLDVPSDPLDLRQRSSPVLPRSPVLSRARAESSSPHSSRALVPSSSELPQGHQSRHESGQAEDEISNNEDGSAEGEMVSESEEGVDITQEFGKLEISADDIDIDFEDLAYKPRGWNLAFQKWLDLILSHYRGMRYFRLLGVNDDSLTKRISTYLDLVELTSVEVHFEHIDERMQGITDAMQNHVYIEQDRTALRNWLVAHAPPPKAVQKTQHTPVDMVKRQEPPLRLHVPAESKWQRPKFGGTQHCETIGLTLFALSLQGVFGTKNYSPEQLSEVLRSQGCNISPAIINDFKNVGEFLGVSKRCCPACNLVVECIRELQHRATQQKLRYPGTHTMWFAVTLPPWTPRFIGEHVLKNAAEALRERAEEIADLEEKEMRKRQATFSPGSDVSPNKPQIPSSPPLEHHDKDFSSDDDVSGEVPMFGIESGSFQVPDSPSASAVQRAKRHHADIEDEYDKGSVSPTKRTK